MKLGQLISSLSTCKPDANVRFGFGSFGPKGFGSYRGYYEDLALDFGELEHKDGKYQYVTVAALLAKCKEAVGATFCGYKGGEYRMDKNTTVWVAGYGDATGVKLDRVVDEEFQVILDTRYEWMK